MPSNRHQFKPGGDTKHQSKFKLEPQPTTSNRHQRSQIQTNLIQINLKAHQQSPTENQHHRRPHAGPHDGAQAQQRPRCPIQLTPCNNYCLPYSSTLPNHGHHYALISNQGEADRQGAHRHSPLPRGTSPGAMICKAFQVPPHNKHQSSHCRAKPTKSKI